MKSSQTFDFNLEGTLGCDGGCSAVGCGYSALGCGCGYGCCASCCCPLDLARFCRVRGGSRGTIPRALLVLPDDNQVHHHLVLLYPSCSYFHCGWSLLRGKEPADVQERVTAADNGDVEGGVVAADADEGVSTVDVGDGDEGAAAADVERGVAAADVEEGLAAAVC